MPGLTMLFIAGGAWLVLLVFVLALCAVASRADAQGPQGEIDWEDLAPPPPPPVVVDTGGMRAHLRAGAGLIAAEQLSVIGDIDGTDAVLATSRAVFAAQPGDWTRLRTPVRCDGQAVATLQAIRRPGAPAFDHADRLALEAIAARVAGSLDAARQTEAREFAHH